MTSPPVPPTARRYIHPDDRGLGTSRSERDRRNETQQLTPAGRRLVVRDREKHVGVARLIERAVAGQVATTELPLGVLACHGQPAREKVFSVPANRLLPAHSQGMRITPLGRSSDYHNPRRQPRSSPT